MGINDEIGDAVFNKGMLADAPCLGDQGTKSASGVVDPNNPDWIPAFKQDIHGMILVTGDCHETVTEKLAGIEKTFLVGAPNATMHEVIRIVGDVRPGAEKGHEQFALRLPSHSLQLLTSYSSFGFLDGISQPAIRDVDTKPKPGQETVDQGITLLGRVGDPTPRPSWALDGSFLAFRYLFQLVPEFDTFLKQNPIPGLPPAEGSELLGARLVGRWKSGA